MRRADDLLRGGLPAYGAVMVKIDVEGAELMALRGMPDLIGRPETVFLIEVSDCKLRQNGSSADGLFDMMRRSGYSPFLPSYSPLSFKLQMRPLTRLSRPEKTYDGTVPTGRRL